MNSADLQDKIDALCESKYGATITIPPGCHYFEDPIRINCRRLPEGGMRIDATNARIWCRCGGYVIEGLHDPNPMLAHNPWDHRVQIIGGRYVATTDSPLEGNGVWAHCTNLNCAWLAPESAVNFDSWVRLRNANGGWSENNTLGHAGWKVHLQDCEQAPIIFDDGGPYPDGTGFGSRSFARTIVDNIHVAGRTGLMDLLGSAKVYDSWFFVGGNVAPTCQRMAWLADNAQLYNCVLNFGFEGTAKTTNDYNSAHIFSSNRFTGKLPEAWRNNVTNCRWRVRYEDKSRDAAETNG